MSRPLVSVVMAVKDGERYISQAIDSVFAQTLQNYELVVVDGGSVDGSVGIARSYDGVRVVAQRGSGFAGAWNEGIAMTRGELVAFLDSDDCWVPHKLEAQVGLLETRPEAACAVGLARFFLEPGHRPPPGFRPSLLKGEFVAYMPGALLARRELFEKTIGPFRTDQAIANDIDWFARLKDAGITCAVLPEVVIRKRIHGHNLSLSAPADYNRELVEVLRESVGRTR
ncbi:MAG: glycosyltransferase [Solirubrobacterales bacterium]|nr:glycosyltransferase [Solirubrobacterales bacterium]